MQTTTNFGLRKPEATDFYNVEDVNANMDIIDEELKKLESGGSGLEEHVANKENPHGVTKEQIGLSNVENYSVNDMKPTYTVPSVRMSLVSGEILSTAFGKIAKAINYLYSHMDNVSNPHEVTAEQVGLGNVDNTADADKPVSDAVQVELDEVNENLTELNGWRRTDWTIVYETPRSVALSQSETAVGDTFLIVLSGEYGAKVYLYIIGTGSRNLTLLSNTWQGPSFDVTSSGSNTEARMTVTVSTTGAEVTLNSRVVKLN